MVMNSKSLIGILVFGLSISFPALAQEGNSTVSQINEIKKAGEYVYAEATMPEQEQAKDGAMALLQAGIESWLKSSDLSQGTFDLSLFDYHVKVINAKRGNQHRVFVYISKSDLTGVKENKNVPISTKKEHKPVVTDVQVVDLTDCVAAETNISVDKKSPSYQLNDVEEEMVCIRKFDEIKSFVENLKLKGRLNRYGKYATLPKNGKFHMFIYSQTGDVVACLLKTDDGYYNLRELTFDSIDNYKKCGSIWLEIIK